MSLFIGNVSLNQQIKEMTYVLKNFYNAANEEKIKFFR